MPTEYKHWCISTRHVTPRDLVELRNSPDFYTYDYGYGTVVWINPDWDDAFFRGLQLLSRGCVQLLKLTHGTPGIRLVILDGDGEEMETGTGFNDYSLEWGAHEEVSRLTGACIGRVRRLIFYGDAEQITVAAWGRAEKFAQGFDCVQFVATSEMELIQRARVHVGSLALAEDPPLCPEWFRLKLCISDITDKGVILAGERDYENLVVACGSPAAAVAAPTTRSERVRHLQFPDNTESQDRSVPPDGSNHE